MAKGGVASTDVAFLAHGTTLIINALTERNGVKTALITLLQHVYEIRRTALTR